MDTLPKPYELSPPTEMEALRYYTQGFSLEEANQIWNQACKACNAHKDGAIDDLKVLNRIFDHLSQLSGLAGVYGMSLKVRLMSYCNLRAVVDCGKAFQSSATIIPIHTKQEDLVQKAG